MRNNNGTDPVVANAMARQYLLATAPRMLKDLGTFSGSLSGNTRVKLFNVGILTRLIIRVEAQVDIATAVTTVSPKSGYALINRLKLSDFDGSDRINVSGFQLYQRASVRKRWPYGLNNEAGAAQFTNPLIPTAVANNQALEFFAEVPIAFDPDRGDLRGAILAQTGVGELYLSIDWASSIHVNGDDDRVYNGGATSVVTVDSINLRVFQEYLLPQESGGAQVVLPQEDLLTVYELQGGVRSTSDFAANTEKLLNVPNVREVVGAYFSYRHNSILGGATSPTNDLNKFRIYVNGNNILREYNRAFQLMEQRNHLNGDLGAQGVYFWDFLSRPIKTWLYGNVQIGVTPTTSPTGVTDIETMYENFYVKGAVLPGLGQTS